MSGRIDTPFLNELTAALELIVEYPFTHAYYRPLSGTQHSTPEPGQRDLTGLYRPPTTTVPPPSTATEAEEDLEYRDVDHGSAKAFGLSRR
jgi:hypothetical protein